MQRKSGVVVKCFPKSESPFVANVIFTLNEPSLFVIPRSCFFLEPEVFLSISTYEREERLKLLELGEEITFKYEAGSQVITEFSRRPYSDPALYPHLGSSSESDVITVTIHESVVISKERIRRVWSDRFGIVDVGPDHSLYPQIFSFYHDIPYVGIFEFSLDFNRLSEFTRPEDYNPGVVRCELIGFRPKITEGAGPYLAQEAPWNVEDMMIRFNPIHVDLHLRYITNHLFPRNERFNQPLLIVDVKGALFCPNFPHLRAILPYPKYGGYGSDSIRDIKLSPGYWINIAELYYSNIHSAYIAYEYQPGWGPYSYRCLPDGSTALLMDVKLNFFNSFFSTPEISFISDPNNLLHGLIDGLGKTVVSDPSNKIEGDYKYGEVQKAEVWVRYTFSKATPAKFEIVALGEAMKHRVREHKPFTSIGMVVSDGGQIYCPYVCNGDLRLSKTLSVKGFRVGSWIEFEGQFCAELGYYEIFEASVKKKNALKAVESMPKFKTIRLANGDYAFEIPFMPRQFPFVHRPFLFNKGSEQLAIFVELYYHCQPVPPIPDVPIPTFTIGRYRKKVKKPAPPPKLGIPVWCQMNKEKSRLTPLHAIGLEQPVGVEV